MDIDPPPPPPPPPPPSPPRGTKRKADNMSSSRGTNPTPNGQTLQPPNPADSILASLGESLAHVSLQQQVPPRPPSFRHVAPIFSPIARLHSQLQRQNIPQIQLPPLRLAPPAFPVPRNSPPPVVVPLERRSTAAAPFHPPTNPFALANAEREIDRLNTELRNAHGRLYNASGEILRLRQRIAELEERGADGVEKVWGKKRRYSDGGPDGGDGGGFGGGGGGGSVGGIVGRPLDVYMRSFVGGVKEEVD